mgnify:CR=1 FL=1
MGNLVELVHLHVVLGVVPVEWRGLAFFKPRTFRVGLAGVDTGLSRVRVVSFTLHFAHDIAHAEGLAPSDPPR